MKKNKEEEFDEMKEFDFSKARRITPAERRMYRKAYENTFGEKMPTRGRPPKKIEHKYKDIHLKIHPKALEWAKLKAKKKGVGYQTIINETLLRHAV